MKVAQKPSDWPYRSEALSYFVAAGQFGPAMLISSCRPDAQVVCRAALYGYRFQLVSTDFQFHER